MKEHGKNSTIQNTKRNPAPSEGHAGKNKELYTEDKCATIGGLCKQGRTSEMHKEIRTLIQKITPKLNVIKDAKGETLTENDNILA